MNKLFLIIILFAFSQISKAQQPSVQSPVQNINQVFLKAEIEPEFPGGEAAWEKYLDTSMNAPWGDYKAKVTFIISDNGIVSNVSAETEIGDAIDKEIIRVIKASPRWKPARQNDRNVNFLTKRELVISIQQPVIKMPPDDNKIFTAVEIQPSYPHGLAAWNKHIDSAVNADLRNSYVTGGIYNVGVRFIISDSGKISNIQTTTNNGFGIEAAVQRAINASPRWNPAVRNGRKIRYLYSTTVQITIQQPVGTSVVEAPADDNMVFTKVEIEATYPGGVSKWRRYIEGAINLTSIKQNKPPNGTYVVKVKFIVSKEGVVSNVSAETNKGYGMEEEAIRVVKASGKWNPGNQNGHNVVSWHIEPITIKVGED